MSKIISVKNKDLTEILQCLNVIENTFNPFIVQEKIRKSYCLLAQQADWKSYLVPYYHQ